MTLIPEYSYNIGDWDIKISDSGGLNKKKPNKLDFNKLTRECLFIGCNEVIRINRTSGLCNLHEFHQHDLLLEVSQDTGTVLFKPVHKEVIDSMMAWAKPLGYNLTPFFEKISTTIPGNVPDVTSLANDVYYPDHVIPHFKDVYLKSIKDLTLYFPNDESSLNQNVNFHSDIVSITTLSHILIGLIICEEANRGDRWHCKHIRNDEGLTTKLGGIMPIAYYATKSFNWGIEMGKAARLLTR